VTAPDSEPVDRDEPDEIPAQPDESPVESDEIPAQPAETSDPVDEDASEASDAVDAVDVADEDADDEDEDEDDEEPDPRADLIYDCNDPTRRREGFEEARSALGRSGLVVMPTDTVYGVAADAFDPTGVRRLLRAKGRSRRMPTPVLIGSQDTLRALAARIRPEARELARAFWPGGLTLICRQQPSLQWDLGDSRGTVALRMPDHADALALLSDYGPLAVSSANLTSRPAATTVDEAYEMLGESVDVYLDAGPTPGSVASTIVDATGEELVMVREGVISLAALREVVPEVSEPEAEQD